MRGEIREGELKSAFWFRILKGRECAGKGKHALTSQIVVPSKLKHFKLQFIKEKKFYHFVLLV